MQNATCAAAAAAAPLPLHLRAHVSALMQQDAGDLFPSTDEAPAAREAAAWNFPGIVDVVVVVVVVIPVVVVVHEPPGATVCLPSAF